MRLRLTVTAVTVLFALGVAAGALFLSGALTSRAVQNPSISIDMVTTGNSYAPGVDNDLNGYPDPGTNMMTVGVINNSSTGSQNVTHNHTVHLIVNNVEDLVGWQARANYIGDRMRCSLVSFVPFNDTFTGQNIGFANLPVDQASFVHRTVTEAGGTCPAAPPDNTNTPQTHIFGATYNGGTEGPVDFATSPDSPAKPVADEPNQTYSTTGGGILASITLQVVGAECNTGPMLFDLDDGTPNPPGTKVAAFTGAGTTDIFLAESALGDGTHTETGGTCPTPTPTATVGGTATPTATATATATAT